MTTAQEATESITVNSPVVVDRLSYSYKGRVALDDVSFSVKAGEIFGLLGPNGGGKSTTFRILSTFLPFSDGRVRLFGLDPAVAMAEIRRRIGVVFQSSSLDRLLTVEENLIHQGRLYGLKGREARQRADHLITRLQLRDRARDLVASLSGGLRRRAEIAKSMLHRPELLLLDEPSTGLDPVVRLELWTYLEQLRSEDGVTVVLTTHFLEEAERCDRLGILDQGKLIAIGTPDDLKREVGGEVIDIRSRSAYELQETIRRDLGVVSEVINGTVRLEHPRGHELIPRLMESYPGLIDSLTIGRPTLEDVFIHRTGHRLQNGGEK